MNTKLAFSRLVGIANECDKRKVYELKESHKTENKIMVCNYVFRGYVIN